MVNQLKKQSSPAYNRGLLRYCRGARALSRYQLIVSSLVLSFSAAGTTDASESGDCGALSQLYLRGVDAWENARLLQLNIQCFEDNTGDCQQKAQRRREVEMSAQQRRSRLNTTSCQAIEPSPKERRALCALISALESENEALWRDTRRMFIGSPCGHKQRAYMRVRNRPFCSMYGVMIQHSQRQEARQRTLQGLCHRR